MTYDEKLHKIVMKLKSERELTRMGHKTKVRLHDRSFSKVRILDICKLLLKLQDDEGALVIVDSYQSTEAYDPEGPKNGNYDDVELIDVELDGAFDQWYEQYLMGQKTTLGNLSNINLLKIYDVVLDINEEVQLTHSATVSFRLLPPIIRFEALFPADSIELRDEYCENRWNSLKYLKEKEVIDDFKHNSASHRWDAFVTVSFRLSRFEEFYRAIAEEYEKRDSQHTESKKPEEVLTSSSRLVIKTLAKTSYDPKIGMLDIQGKPIKLNKDSFRAKLIELILKDEKSKKKEWSWDEVIEEIEGITDTDELKESRNKLYSACDGLTKFIAQKTGINDLLIFTKSTAQLNPKYL